MTRWIKVLGVFLVAPLVLRADILRLKSGIELEGIVKRQEGKIILERDGLTIKFAPKDVQEIIEQRAPLQELRERMTALKDTKDANKLYELAQWAQQHNLSHSARQLLKRVIKLAPNHHGARTQLGFQLYKGKWMTQEELLKAKGFTFFQGRWVNNLEKEMILNRQKKEALERELVELKEQIRKAKEELHQIAQRRRIEIKPEPLRPLPGIKRWGPWEFRRHPYHDLFWLSFPRYYYPYRYYWGGQPPYGYSWFYYGSGAGRCCPHASYGPYPIVLTVDVSRK